MKRVRVLQDMPFAKVGDEIVIYFYNGVTESLKQGLCIGEQTFDLIIEQGWLEWIEEEKSLEDKLIDNYNKNKYSLNVNRCMKDNAQIAKEHFLSFFDYFSLMFFM